MPIRLMVEYAGSAALKNDWDAQLKMGGFFAAIPAPEGLPPFADVDLVLLVDGVPAITAPGRVTVANATSVCVQVAPAEMDALKAAVEKACAEASASGPPERRSVRLAPDKDEIPRATSAEIPLVRKIALMSIGEKTQLAVSGEADARILLAREKTSAVQMALLRNPKTVFDEVMALARSPHIHPETVDAIGRHPQWGDQAQVALMLVRNPKVGIAQAQAVLPKLNGSDLRLIARGNVVRAPIAAAARKLLGV